MTMVSWLRTKKVRKKLVHNIPLVILRSEVTKDLKTKDSVSTMKPFRGKALEILRFAQDDGHCGRWCLGSLTNTIRTRF